MRLALAAASLGLQEARVWVVLQVGRFAVDVELDGADGMLPVLREAYCHCLRRSLFGKADRRELYLLLQPMDLPVAFSLSWSREQRGRVGALLRDFADDWMDEDEAKALAALSMARQVDPWHDDRGNPAAWRIALGPPQGRHPLELGARIQSLGGEEDGNGEAAPGSIGVVRRQFWSPQAGWGYEVAFPLATRAEDPDATEVVVTIDQGDSIDDRSQYVILEAA